MVGCQKFIKTEACQDRSLSRLIKAYQDRRLSRQKLFKTDANSDTFFVKRIFVVLKQRILLMWPHPFPILARIHYLQHYGEIYCTLVVFSAGNMKWIANLFCKIQFANPIVLPNWQGIIVTEWRYGKVKKIEYS